MVLIVVEGQPIKPTSQSTESTEPIDQSNKPIVKPFRGNHIAHRTTPPPPPHPCPPMALCSILPPPPSKLKRSTKGSGASANVNMMGAVDQNAFGKYGVLREADYFSKQREFEVKS